MDSEASSSADPLAADLAELSSFSEHQLASLVNVVLQFLVDAKVRFIPKKQLLMR